MTAMRTPPGTPLLDRLWLRSEVDPTGCWIWNGSRNHGGYGSIKIHGVGSRLVHRVAYEHLVGPVPQDFQLDHLCRTRACWRPDHLEAVTPLVNVHRSVDQPAVLNLHKTHCHNGHALAGDNLRVHIRRGRPQRQCVACKLARDARFEKVRPKVPRNRPKKIREATA